MNPTDSVVQLPWRLALQLLARAKASGLVSICSGQRRASMVLIEGRVLHATSSTTTRLGESLVDRGVVTAQVLDRVLQMQRRKKKKQPLGTILMELGLVSKAVAEAEIETEFYSNLREKIQIAVESLTIKRKVLEKFTDGNLYPYSKFYLREIRNNSGHYSLQLFTLRKHGHSGRLTVYDEDRQQ